MKAFNRLVHDLAENHESWLKQIEALLVSRFRPHLWIEVTDDWVPPSLITVNGIRFYRQVEATVPLLEAESKEVIIKLAGSLVKAHMKSSECRLAPKHITSYLYRWKFYHGFRFTKEGVFIEEVKGAFFSPVRVVTFRINAHMA